ncbi:MAG TPA: PadR family transcriptional regulator [Rubrobacter sp.]|nr:PadR family transcriptional regulator [Rubrobacter sp.]
MRTLAPRHPDGSRMLDELGRLGHSVSYSTLYPAPHRMEEHGLLEREDRVEGGQVRKYYSATKKGLKELERVRQMIGELRHEVVEGEGQDPS